MADDHYSSKRKYDDPSPPPRRTGFSSGPPPPASPPAGTAPVPSSYNTVPPPPDEIQLAKQRAQEIAARLFSAAEAKRPRVDNGDDDAGAERGASLGGSGRIGGGGLGFSSSAGGGHGSTISPLSSQGSAHQYSSYGGYQSGSTTKKIDIPNGRVGVIIGKSGETIKHLQLQSGAKIQVTRDMDVQPGSQTRSVDLSGTPDQISRAEQLINDVLAEADAGASGTVSNRKYNPPQPGSEQFQMQIANNKVGLVIGKGGETIKSMQAKSGARIQVIPLHLPPGDPATERTLYIDGTVEQIEIAKQLVNEVTSENRARNTMSGGYPQQGYRPPRPQANWAPGAPATQQPGYGYMQPGAYPGAPPQYGQPPYSSYPPASGGYQTGWDQSSNQQPQQTPPGTGYDYYNQQQQPQQQPAPGTAAPADASSYNYSQPATYASQGYGDSTYSQQSGGQQAYDYSGYQNQGQQQPAYSQQTGYDQQSYGTTGYGSAANSTQDGSAPPSYGGPGGASQASPGKQASTPATGSNPGYSTQPPTSAASSYPAQGSVPPSGYAAPQTQASYGAQPPAQGGYGQGSYGQSPQGQKPPTSAPYGQAAPPASAQAGGYGQYGYGQPGYGAPPPYPGAPPASHPGYGQQQSYGDPYGSGSYGQPPAYSTEATTPAASQDQSAAAPAPAPTTTNAAPPAPANSGPAQTSS
ncbi:uncharacterized protein [Lolium perenne]|uniref:uncharacterized protein n=1 Tax=Lolium perenne TaxID=4522 RepID=UPI0021EA0053|nr:uncharacterized protein LOC127307806 [Lolium perenne]